VDEFQHNAAKIEELRSRLHAAFKVREQSPEKFAAWQEAARLLHSSYDTLAFPGGLHREFELLRVGDAGAIEMAVQFLESDPWYFRSGYHKADMLKWLGRHTLTNDQCARLRKIILGRVRGRSVREMRAYGKVASQINNPEFEAELREIAERSNRRAAGHAQMILNFLR
jgi:hypothetical protein